MLKQLLAGGATAYAHSSLLHGMHDLVHAPVWCALKRVIGRNCPCQWLQLGALLWSPLKRGACSHPSAGSPGPSNDSTNMVLSAGGSGFTSLGCTVWYKQSSELNNRFCIMQSLWKWTVRYV